MIEVLVTDDETVDPAKTGSPQERRDNAATGVRDFVEARTGVVEQRVRVGLNESNDWRARTVRPDTKGVMFRLDAPNAEFSGEYRINLLGRHQVVNALFAIAVGAELGLGVWAAGNGGYGHCLPAGLAGWLYLGR